MARTSVRRAVAEDADAVAELLGDLGYPRTPDFAQGKLETLLESDSDVVLLAEVEEGVVGVAHLHAAELFHETGRIGRVMAIAVNEGFRRRGVGRMLMGAVEEYAREMGCVRIEITSSPHHEGAHEFYRQVGYADGKRHFVKALEPQQ